MSAPTPPPVPHDATQLDPAIVSDEWRRGVVHAAGVAVFCAVPVMVMPLCVVVVPDVLTESMPGGHALIWELPSGRWVAVFRVPSLAGDDA